MASKPSRNTHGLISFRRPAAEQVFRGQASRHPGSIRAIAVARHAAGSVPDVRDSVRDFGPVLGLLGVA